MIHKTATPSTIAEGSKSQGTFYFTAPSEIFGVIDGNIEQQSADSLLIGKSGWIRGTIHSEGPVLVEGRIEGEVHSKTRIVIRRSAIIIGHLYSPQIEIEGGSLIEGELHMRHLSKPVTRATPLAA